MRLKLLYICLALEILFLAVKYYILKHFQDFKTFTKSSLSKNKIHKKNLNAVQIVLFSNKVFKLFKINSCLIKSVTIRELLKKQGYKSNLIIGIKNDTGTFESHCWLEIQNKMYTHDKDISKFKIITKI